LAGEAWYRRWDGVKGREAAEATWRLIYNVVEKCLKLLRVGKAERGRS
jgi:hypothetical protein